MDARLTLAIAAAITVLLGSCQQGFTDKEVRDSNTPLSPTLPVPSGDPASVNPLTLNFSSQPITVGKAASLWSLIQPLIENSIDVTAINSASVAPVGTAHPSVLPRLPVETTATPKPGSVSSGLTGYNVVWSPNSPYSYDPITNPLGNFYGPTESLIGTWTSSKLDYLEASDAYFGQTSPPPVGVKLYKKALHRLYDYQATSTNIDNSVETASSVFIKGTYNSRVRGEYFADINNDFIDTEGTRGPQYARTYTGLFEVSTVWVLACAGQITDVQAGLTWYKGKAVITVSYALPLTTTFATIANGDPQFSASYTVTIYDDNDKQVYQVTQLMGSNFRFGAGTFDPTAPPS